MVLPVVAYGHPVLKHVAEDIEENSPEIQQLIADMFETMYHTEGVGLAAPQINKSIHLRAQRNSRQDNLSSPCSGVPRLHPCLANSDNLP